MPLKWLPFEQFSPDSGGGVDDLAKVGVVGGTGVYNVKNLVPGPHGYSGAGGFWRRILGGGITGTPSAIAWHPLQDLAYMATVGSGTSRIYSSALGGTWTSRVGGATTASQWFLLPWGNSTLAVGGPAQRMQAAVGTGGAFANTATNISPKFIARFQNRVFVANVTWSGISGVGWTSGVDGHSLVWASATDNPQIFGTPTSNPGLRTLVFPLMDDYGEITGLAATESYILVAKTGALIIGRPSSTYDVDWSYLAYYGTTASSSLVVSGNDIYLWTQRGPVVVKADPNGQSVGIEELAPGVQDALRPNPTSIIDTDEIFVPGTPGPASICGTQDMVSGVVTWTYEGAVGNGHNRAFHYDPVSGRTSWSELGDAVDENGGDGDMWVSAVCRLPKLEQVAGGFLESPLRHSLLLRKSDGAVYQWARIDEASTYLRPVGAPRVSTHWYGDDSGGMASTTSVAFPFGNYVNITPMVRLQWISDRGNAVIESSEFTGVDASGRVDLSASPAYQLAKLTFELGTDPASYGVRNWRGVEVDSTNAWQPGG